VAAASTGYTFIGWTVVSGTGVSIAAPSALSTTATLTDGNAEVRANFAINTYTITATAGEHGQITPSGVVTLNYGSDQSFTIIPDANYQVADVVVDGHSVGAGTDYQFSNVTDNHSIHATFAMGAIAPVITSTPLTSVREDRPYSYDVEATGSPAPMFSLATYPAGMTIDPNTGLIQWTPTGTGNFDVTVEAINVGGTGSQGFTIHVLPIPPEVWVDNIYTSGGFNDGRTWNYDAFDKIQDGVNDVAPDGTVHILTGMYEEQVVIGKRLSLVGAGITETTIQSPMTLPQFFTTGGPNHPIVFVNGAEVIISNLKIDGLARGNANSRFVGIAYWNAGGALSNVEITHVRENPFSGAQHGIGLYAFNNTGGPYVLSVSNVAVADIQKAGIVLGGAGLTSTVTGCSVTGQGPTAVTAQNGIQIGFGAIGTVTGCTISGIAYTGGQWGASGILFYEAANGAVGGGSVVSGSESAIVFHETSGSVDGAVVNASGTNNEEGVSVRDYGVAMSLSAKEQLRAASPLVDPWNSSGKKSAATWTIVTLSNLDLNGVGAPGSYGVGAWALGETAIVNLTDSDIEGWSVGVVSYDDGAVANVAATHNRIHGNTYGFWTNSALGAMAERNWWGSDRGPTYLGNPRGDGDSVTASVDYEPWCNYDFTICDITVSCCSVRVGNANGIGTYPNEVTISDIQLLVFAKFISSLPCEQNLPCLSEADVNQTGGANPTCNEITISDIQTLVNHLFIAGPVNAPLKTCL